MSSSNRIVGIVLAFLLSGMLDPAMLLAQNTNSQTPTSTQTTQPSSAPTSDQQQSGQQNEPLQQQQDKASQELINGTPDTGKELPESPDTIRAREAAKQNAQQQRPNAEPSGTAAAQEGALVGSTASRPAGAAIAPAKQKQVRSFLIKFGVIAGAGVALGTVYALSRAGGSTPPGAR
jgi:hypothetical protein